MKNYVLGFCFNHDLSRVALIEKKKPEWQAGLLNGIGGKIEPKEFPIDAMVREFLEEAGVKTTAEMWIPFCDMGSEGWKVKCFYMRMSEGFDMITTKEEEEIVKVDVSNILEVETIPNLKWLIPLAIDKHEDVNYSISIF